MAKLIIVSVHICLCSRFIYKEFPPKNATHKLDESVKSTKKQYKSASIHYHPDRQKEHGEKWVVICEEISKYVNQRYDCFKRED